MNTNLIKQYIKPAIYIVISFISLYGIIYLLTRKPQIPIEYKAAIDSINRANAILIENQRKMDSAITVYEGEVDKIDFQIDNIKEKTTIVKEYHHEVIERTNHYDAGQVDSFFKSRYNY
jgi:hypothetical protein